MLFSWEEDPNGVLCPFEFGGSCRDAECKYIHQKVQKQWHTHTHTQTHTAIQITHNTQKKKQRTFSTAYGFLYV